MRGASRQRDRDHENSRSNLLNFCLKRRTRSQKGDKGVSCIVLMAPMEKVEEGSSFVYSCSVCVQCWNKGDVFTYSLLG